MAERNGRGRKKRSFLAKWKRMSPRKKKRYIRVYSARLLVLLTLLMILFLGVKAVGAVVHHFFPGDGTDAGQIISESSETSQLSEAPETSESKAEKEPEIKTLTLTAVGDCSLGKLEGHSENGSFVGYYNNYGADYFLSNVKEIFEQDDVTVANCEGVLSESTGKVEKEFNIKGKPGYAKILSGSSVEVVSLANNHTLDYGEKGLADTKKALDDAGVEWAYKDKVSKYTTSDGLVVGFVSEILCTVTEERKQTVMDGIASLKADGVNLVVVCLHWGVEKQNVPKEQQVELAHSFIDAGADLIVGHHPHVLQGVEMYKNKMICYSLGNFCFGGNLNPKDKNSMIFRQTFTFADGVVQDDLKANIIPCRISSSDSKNNFKPTPAKAHKQEIIDLVNKYSAKVGDVSFDNDGNMIGNTRNDTNEDTDAVNPDDNGGTPGEEKAPTL